MSRTIWKNQDFDQVDSAGVAELQTLQRGLLPAERASLEVLAGCVAGLQSPASGLYLDRHEHFTIEGDEVELGVGCANSAAEDAPARALQMRSGECFTALAEFCRAGLRHGQEEPWGLPRQEAPQPGEAWFRYALAVAGASCSSSC